MQARPSPVFSSGAVLATPWGRFWAKALDLSVWGLLLSYGVDLTYPALFSGPAFEGSSGATLSTLLLLPFAMVIDALVLSIFGTTPGALAAGFRIEMYNHQRLPVRHALRRNLLIYFRGLCLGIPLFSFFTLWNAYKATSAGKLASWDEELFTRAFSYGSGMPRTVLAAVLTIVVRLVGFIAIPLLTGTLYAARPA